MVSTWGSGMISRVTVLAVVLALAVNVAARAGPVNDFIKAQFKEPVSVQSVTVTGEVARLCVEVLGRPYPYGTIQYWGNSDRNVWVLAAQGKHGLIIAGFAVEDARIRNAGVLADREQRGRPIRSRRFLQQFQGIGLRRKGKLTGRIDAITGATISSTAMKKMAVLALHLDALCRSECEGTAKDQ